MFNKCIVCKKRCHSKGTYRKFCSQRCYYVNKNKETAISKKKLWEENKDKIMEMRKNGFSYKTLEKRFRLKGKNSPLRENLKGIRQERNARSFYKVPVNLNPSNDLYYICGVLHGDGWIRNGKHYQNENSRMCGIGLDVIDRDFAENFSRCCTNIGLNPALFKHKRKYLKRGFVWRVMAWSSIFVDWFEALDYDHFNNIGNEYKADFLRGIFDSEGSVNKYNINITSTDYDLMELISNLMEDVGFGNEIKTVDTVLRGNPYRMYRIYLNKRDGAKDFLELIQPSIARKQWENA